MARLLLVEDDILIARTLSINLPLCGFELVHCDALCKARALLKEQTFDLVLLDVGLPDGLGHDLCREIRMAWPNLPVLMLTARIDEDSAVKGITSGADDYIRKPFGQEELVARIRRRLQRSTAGEDHIIGHGDLKINLQTRVIMAGDRQLNLSKKEYEVLVILVKNSGVDVTREQLMAAIDDEGKIFDRTLDVYISRLRQKLGEAGMQKIQITSVYGIGYRLENL